MDTLTYCFYVAVMEDGHRVLSMNTYPLKYTDLSLILIDGHYCEEKLVTDAVIGLRNVVSGSIDSFLFASDCCTIDAKSGTTNIIIYFEDTYSFQLPTLEILKLFDGWLGFLNSYYSNKIPGLSFPAPKINWIKS